MAATSSGSPKRPSGSSAALACAPVFRQGAHQWRIDRTGSDRVDANALGRHLARQRLGQADDPRLRRGVMDQFDPADLAELRGDVDDASRFRASMAAGPRGCTGRCRADAPRSCGRNRQASGRRSATWCTMPALLTRGVGAPNVAIQASTIWATSASRDTSPCTGGHRSPAAALFARPRALIVLNDHIVAQSAQACAATAPADARSCACDDQPVFIRYLPAWPFSWRARTLRPIRIP